MIAAMAREGLTMDRLPFSERRHLVSLVREAKDRKIRIERIQQTIAFLKERAGHVGEQY